MTCDFDWSSYLKKGEEVLWQGRPDGRAVLWSWSDLVFLCGVGWVALFVGWSWSAFAAFPIGPLTINPVAVFAIALVAAVILQRFFRDAFVRRRTEYAITTKRALVIDKSRPYLAAQMHLSPELTIFAAGRRYAVVVFTSTSKRLWQWRSAMVFDGPPLRRHPMAGPEAIFLGLPNASDVAALAKKAAKDHTP